MPFHCSSTIHDPKRVGSRHDISAEHLLASATLLSVAPQDFRFFASTILTGPKTFSRKSTDGIQHVLFLISEICLKLPIA